MGDLFTLENLSRLCAAYHGEKGAFAYRAFRWANATIFDDVLPTPLIQFAITPYGGCVGHTAARPEHCVVTLHPSLWCEGRPGGEEGDAGSGAVLDVLIHELLHVYIARVHPPGARAGASSHDNPTWAGLVQRFSPRIPGLERGVIAAPRKSVRREGVVRKEVPKGAISLAALSRWPTSLRKSGSAVFWRRVGMPF